jgi:hypothetical protein
MFQDAGLCTLLQNCRSQEGRRSCMLPVSDHPWPYPSGIVPPVQDISSGLSNIVRHYPREKGKTQINEHVCWLFVGCDFLF